MKLHGLVPLAVLTLAACDDPEAASVDASPPAPRTDAAPIRTDAADEEADAAVLPEPDAMPDATARPDASPPTDADPADDGIPQGSHIVAIVAPSVCQTINGHLRNCDFGRVTVQAPASPGTGQYKTRVVGHSRGDCRGSTFPFAAKLSADGVEPFTYILFWNEQAVLRRDDSTALSSLVAEKVMYPVTGNYGLDCRVWLEVEFNVPITVAP